MQNKTIFALFLLVIATMACTVFVGGPEYPQTNIPVSTEAVGSIQEQLEQAAQQAAQTGELKLALNESQITSMVAYKLQEQTQAGEDPLLTEPQVLLRNGEIQIYGKAKQGNLQANVRIVLAANIDESGKPQISVTSTDFGPFQAPEGLNTTISKMVNEALTGALGPAAIGFRLEDISIADGVMTFSGRIK